MVAKFRMNLTNAIFSVATLLVATSIEGVFLYELITKPKAIAELGLSQKIPFAILPLIIVVILSSFFYRLEISQERLRARVLYRWISLAVNEIRYIAKKGGLASMYVVQAESASGQKRFLYLMGVRDESKFVNTLIKLNAQVRFDPQLVEHTKAMEAD